MKKIPFDLAYYQAHHPQVVTREGGKARILCTDLHYKKFPVVAAYFYPREMIEFPNYFTATGHLSTSENSRVDLFMLVDDD